MRRWFRPGLFLGIFFLGSVAPLYALQVPDRPNGYVTDKAVVFSPEAKRKLEQFLRDFEAKTSNQVVVVTFPGLEGESLEDFSVRLAERWKVGQKGRNNGVIFLVFKDARQMRIEVGYGLEGVLPDALAGQILSEIVTPYFRKGAYEDGIFAGVDAICRATQGEFQGGTKSHGTSSNGGGIFFFFLVGICFVTAVDAIRFAKYALARHGYPHRYGFGEWWFRFAFLFFLLNMFSQMRVYSGGGYYGGGSQSGGFSGGGGSFGGGGASGRW